MGMQIHPTPADPFNELLETGNQFFALVFNGEAIMKLAAMHLNYFHDSWNCFDFLCVFAGDVILIIEGTVGSNASLGQTVSIFRIFRIARLFRLVRFLKGLNQLVRAFVLSVPKLLNVGLIMGLLIYLYAILGVSLFAKIGYLDGVHNEQANFRNFPSAVSVLVRSMTGEAWNEIMHELSKSRFYMESYMDVACIETFPVTASNFASLDLNGDGVVDAPNQCGSALGAYIYFITFTLSVTFVILNLFIAVILDGFEESQHNEIADIIHKSLEVWKKYDPECTMQLPLEKALDYIDEVVEAVCKRGAAEQALKGGTDVRPSKRHTMGRYDSMYTGEIKAGVHSFAYYNLQYMRVLALRVGEPSAFEVRFVVVVKAILRRLVCQCVDPEGNIQYHGQNKTQIFSNLYDLENLELATQGGNEPLKAELARLKALERRQKRANVDYFNMLPTRLQAAQPAAPVRQSTASSDGRSSAPLPVSSELALVEEVAAAKIQRRIKELLQKRRARSAEEPFGGGSASRPGSSYGPITRAAG